MKLSLTSLAILALGSLSLAQDDSWSSASSAPPISSSSPSPSAAPSATSSLNSTAPDSSGAAVAGKFSNSTNSLASNSTGSLVGSGVPPSPGNVTLPNSALNVTGPDIPADAPVNNITVPSTDSASCSSFLTALNSDSNLHACLVPTLLALESDTASVATFCNVTATQACPSGTIRRYLAYFSGNCSQELASSDKNILPLYDALYLITPMTQAACAKDANGDFCAASKLSNDTSVAGSATNAAQEPLDINGLPNTNAFNAKNIPFLGANPSLDEQDLCTTCTRNVLTNYFAFEAMTPYTGGLVNSPLLGSQNPLYSAIQTKCPADFLSSALDNAGAAPGAFNGAVSFIPAKGLISLMMVAAAFLSL